MRITDIKTLICNAEMRNWVFVKVETDQDGLTGWGEATLEWKTRAVTGAIDDLKAFVVGRDPRDIEQNVQLLVRRGFWRPGSVVMTAISGIEIALWDILGQALGVPVWRLLGGKVRDGLRTYTHLGMGEMGAVYDSLDGDRLIDRARAVQERGYAAFKLVNIPYCAYVADRQHLRALTASMLKLRETVGDDVEVMLDFHGRPASVSAARAFIEAAKPVGPMFIEEPLPPEDIAGLAELRAACGVPIAAGERLHSRAAFQAALSARALDIAQPDICHAGGLWETRKIAAMAETVGVALAPHNPLGPIAGVAALHFGIATPNVIIQEEMVGAVPWYDEAVRWPIERAPGMWDVPTLPGLGIEVDEAVIAAHPYRQEILHSENAVLPDGTVTDW